MSLLDELDATASAANRGVGIVCLIVAVAILAGSCDDKPAHAPEGTTPSVSVSRQSGGAS